MQSTIICINTVPNRFTILFFKCITKLNTLNFEEIKDEGVSSLNVEL